MPLLIRSLVIVVAVAVCAGLPGRVLGADGATEHPRTLSPFEPPAQFDMIVGWTTIGIEAAGIATIVLGIVLSTSTFLARIWRRRSFEEAYSKYRAELGRGILLGLELLVAADIIGTVAISPSFTSVGVLGLIVLIRTFLSFAIELEVDGRWPWQAAGPAQPRA